MDTTWLRSPGAEREGRGQPAGRALHERSVTVARMPTDAAWSSAKRVAFRFVFVLLTLECAGALAFAVPLARKPPFKWAVYLYWQAWGGIIAWLTQHVFGFTPKDTLEGSDSEVAWMKLFWTVVFSAIGATVWTLLARRMEYRKLADRHRTLVRHTLAATMFMYGLDKVFKLQFWAPTPTDLAQTFGGSSPFGLVWRFVGASAPYTIFSGLMECVGAALLLSRRTTTLGALVTAAVLVNVVMLNFCYGIPVKNFSSMLLAFAVYLDLAGVARLFEFLVLRRPIVPLELRPFPFTPRGERARMAVKAVWIVSLLWMQVDRMIRVRSKFGDAAPKPTLWGLYDVEELQRDGVAVPLLITDAKVWQQVSFGSNFGPCAMIATVDGEHHVFDTEHDDAKGTVTLTDGDDKKTELHVQRPDATHLELSGDYYGEHLQVRLRAHDLGGSILTSRGFRWVDDGGFWR
jgi:hypothetical protein